MIRVLVIFFLITNPLFAQVQKEVALKRIDQTHEQIGQTILKYSNRIDSFFGSERADDFHNGSKLRLFHTLGKEEGEELTNETRIRFHLRLPQLQKLLKISFKKDAVHDEEKKPPTNSDLKKEKSKFSSLVDSKLLKQALRKWTFRLTTGIKVSFPPQVFVKAKAQRIHFVGKWKFQFEEELFWFNRDGFGETTSYNMDRQLEKDLLFRFQNTATWTDDNDTISFQHGPTLYHTLSPKRAIAYNAKVRLENKPTIQSTEYLAFINYRQLLYKKWFFYEFTPGLLWPRDKDWSTTPFASIKFEFVFGSI